MSDFIQEKHEIKQDRIIVDPRSIFTKIWDGLEKPWIPLTWAIISCILIVLVPGLVIPCACIQLVLWLAVVSKPDVLPIHLPLDAEKTDLNDPKPGINRGHYKSRGSFFIGRIISTGTEVWASFKALTQHFLIFGTTGSGKTESIVSYICNFLSVGSGFAFNDAKAAPKAMVQIATICRIFARDDDFRVTNYIKGSTSKRIDPAERVSNDAAVFARGSAEANIQLLVSLMPPSKGENQIFSERAIALVAAAMPGLIDLRDLGIIQIDPAVIRDHMGIQKFAELMTSNNISKRSRDALEAYLKSLPGFNPKKSITDQPEEVARQFGFAQAYFTRSLSSLSDTYGHIYLVGQGEIDYQDAVINGRCIMTLLPSLEKSGEELANLGKIVQTAMRNGMVVGLGTVFEGSIDDVAINLPTNSEIPYGIYNDEDAYMLVEGQEMFNAQARGLGFSITTGTQDISGMLLNLEKTTKQIMANSAFKQFGFLDDEDTTRLAIELAGEASVMVRNGYELQGDVGTYYASPNAQIEKRPRLTSTALKKRGLGQAFILYQGKMHDVQLFNHGLEEQNQNPLLAWLPAWYSVRMAKIRLPNQERLDELLQLSNRAEWRELKEILSDSSRMMLREMKIYFGSMLTIQRMATAYMNDPEMLDMASDYFGARELLEFPHEEPTGILKIVCDNAPRSYKDTHGLLSKIAEEYETESSKLVDLANEAALDAIDIDSPFDAPFTDDDSAQTGGAASGGGSGRGPKVDSSVEPQGDALMDYLGTIYTPRPADSSPVPTDPDEFGAPPAYEEEDYPSSPSSYDDLMYTDQEPIPDPIATAPRSDLANAVERNLANMPWMTSAVEYSAISTALAQTEQFFQPNADVAKASVEAGLERLGGKLQYPESKLPSTDLKRLAEIALGLTRRQ